MLRDKPTQDELWEAEIRLTGKKVQKDKRDRHFSRTDFFYSPLGKVKNRCFVGEVEVHVDKFTLRDYLEEYTLHPHITITMRRGRKKPDWLVITSTLEAFEQTSMWAGMTEEERTNLRYAYYKQKDEIVEVRTKLKNALTNNIDIL